MPLNNGRTPVFATNCNIRNIVKNTLTQKSFSITILYSSIVIYSRVVLYTLDNNN